MEPGMNLIEADDLFNSHSVFGVFVNSEEGYESCWQWPQEIGNGSVYMIKLRPGLVLVIADYQLRDSIAVNCGFQDLPIVLCFNVAGSMCYTFNGEKGPQKAWNFNSGHSMMAYLPEWQGIAEYQAGFSMRGVCLYIDPLLLNNLMEGQHDRIPTRLCNVVNGDKNNHFFRAAITTPQTNITLRQILDCPYRGPLKRLYLESKALELLTQGMAQVVFPGNSDKKDTVLRADDIERIRVAKDILVNSLENPPSLLGLAVRVGINKNKLNRGFQQVFGTSVFSYLRACRLEHARDLLESKKMSVTEVALEVGYSQQSAFSRAFIKHFGTSPKDLLR
jgi:AraC family transcriptional activator of pyochelin receptor